jgi:hypothetical protein
MVKEVPHKEPDWARGVAADADKEVALEKTDKVALPAETGGVAALLVVGPEENSLAVVYSLALGKDFEGTLEGRDKVVAEAVPWVVQEAAITALWVEACCFGLTGHRPICLDGESSFHLGFPGAL